MPVSLERMVEDGAADPKHGTTAEPKFVYAKVAGAIGNLTSVTTIPEFTLYRDAGSPQISPSATNPRYTRQGFETAFTVIADGAQLGSSLGKYAVGTLKGKAIAVIDDRTTYGQGVVDQFTKSIIAAGAHVVAKEFTTDMATDFSATLTTRKSKKNLTSFFWWYECSSRPHAQENAIARHQSQVHGRRRHLRD